MILTCLKGLRQASRTVLHWPFLALMLVFLTYVTVAPPYHNAPAIRSDGMGYHLWTRAILTGDFRFCDINVDNVVNKNSRVEGVCQNKYPPGVALIRLPLMIPFVNLKAHSYEVSAGEHEMSLIAGALSLVLIVLMMLRTMRSFGVRPVFTELAILFLIFGTGTFHYATYDGSFSHIYSEMEITLLLFLLLPLKKEKSSNIKTVLLVLASALLLLTRNTNILAIGWGIFAVFSYFHWKVRPTFKIVWPMIFGAGLGVLTQLAYNRYASGAFTLSSYGEEGFVWSRPMWPAVLLSYKKGLFTYYPILAMLIGAGLFNKLTRKATRIFLYCILSYAIVYGYWWTWQLGGSFGHRGFNEIVPAGILIFGYTLETSNQKTRRFMVLAGAFCTVYTWHLMWQYCMGLLPFADTNRATYWENLIRPDPVTCGFALVVVLLLIHYRLSFRRHPCLE